MAMQTSRLPPLSSSSSRLWATGCGVNDVGEFNDLGARIVAAIGEPAARELLDALTRTNAERAALIGRLHAREDAAWLAELLVDIESDPDDITRLELIRSAPGGSEPARLSVGPLGAP
jgi:hypothetical protein